MAIVGSASLLESSISKASPDWELLQNMMTAASRGKKMVRNLEGFARTTSRQKTNWDPGAGIQQTLKKGHS